MQTLTGPCCGSNRPVTKRGRTKQPASTIVSLGQLAEYRASSHDDRGVFFTARMATTRMTHVDRHEIASWIVLEIIDQPISNDVQRGREVLSEEVHGVRSRLDTF